MAQNKMKNLLADQDSLQEDHQRALARIEKLKKLLSESEREKDELMEKIRQLKRENKSQSFDNVDKEEMELKLRQQESKLSKKFQIELQMRKDEFGLQKEADESKIKTLTKATAEQTEQIKMLKQKLKKTEQGRGQLESQLEILAEKNRQDEEFKEKIHLLKELELQNEDFQKKIIDSELQIQELSQKVQLFESQKGFYENFFNNIKPEREKQENKNQDLLEINKNLSQFLKTEQQKLKKKETEVEYFKQYKDMFKKCLEMRCLGCQQAMTPKQFLQHYEQCTPQELGFNPRKSNLSHNFPSQMYQSRFQTHSPARPMTPPQQHIANQRALESLIQIRINNQKVVQINGSPCLAYMVEVHRQGQQTLHVNRRFKEFNALNRSLRDKYPTTRLPKCILFENEFNQNM